MGEAETLFEAGMEGKFYEGKIVSHPAPPPTCPLYKANKNTCFYPVGLRQFLGLEFSSSSTYLRLH